MTSPDDTSSASGPEQAGLGVIFLTVFIDLVGFSMIFPLFPAMLEYYFGLEGQDSALGELLTFLRGLTPLEGADADRAVEVLFGGVLGSLYATLQFFASPLWGRASDRIGRRKILVLTVGGTALSYLVWTMAGTFSLLLLARFVGGLMSGNISVASAAIADVTDEKSRAKGMGMLGAAFGLGFIIGPALGGGFALIDVTGALSFIPGINPFSAPALMALGLSTVNLVWIWRKFGETLPDRGPQEERAAMPIAKLTNLDIPGVGRVNLVYFIYLFAFTGMEFTLTFLARDRFAYGPGKNVLLFLFVGFIIVLVQGGIVRRVAPKYGEKNVSIVGLVLNVPGMIILGQATSEGAMYLGLGLLSFGSALATPSLTALVSLYADQPAAGGGRQGEVLGVFRALGSLARAIGPLVACSVYFSLGSGGPYFGAAAITVLPLLIGLGLPKPQLQAS